MYPLSNRRSFGIAPLHGTGTVTIEETKLAPSRRSQKYTVDTPGGRRSGASAIHATSLVALALLTVLW